MCKDICIFNDKISKTCNKTIFAIFFLLFSLASFAAELPNHYIIAFDRSVEGRRIYYESSNILKIIDKTLSENKFNYNQDYISIVGYTMEYGNPSIDRYVRAYSNSGTPIIWHKLKGNNIFELFPNWPIGEPTLDYYNSPYGSMQSLAKPYSVMETGNNEKSKMLADRTFLYTITDEVVNGVDDNYRQEWKNASTCSGSNFSMFNAISDDVFSTLQTFNEEFKFLQIQLNKDNLKINKIPISADGVYKIIAYEVVSVERPSVYAITNIPSPLPLQRVKGGFLLKFDSHSLLHKYVIKNVSILDSDYRMLGSTDSGKLHVFLPSEKVSVGDTIRLALTVILKDGLYNGVVISPTNARYSDGMLINQVVKIQNEAKILGVLPLTDIFWWWFYDDAALAVVVWDVILLLIFIILVCICAFVIFKRITYYVPKNKVISISKNS